MEDIWREWMDLFFKKTFANPLSLLGSRNQAFHSIFLWPSVFEPLLIYTCQPQLVWVRKVKKGIWNCSERMFAEGLQKIRTELRQQLPLGLAFGERKPKRTQSMSKDRWNIFFFLNKSVLGREHRVVDDCGFHFPRVLHVCNSLL